MGLYRDPKTVLLEVIEKKNDITLDVNDYDFSDPVPSSPPPDNAGQYNTAVTITANNVAAAYQGEIEFYYNRLKLSDVASMVDLTLRSPNMETSHDILPSLNRRFGLNLTVDDIELLPTEEAVGFRRATLRAVPTSLGWIGETTVMVAEGDLNLEDHLTTVALGGLPYPTNYPTKTFAQFYSYWRDFSDHFDFLSQIQVGDTLGLSMTSVMNDVTDDVWIATGQGEFSLSNATVVYVGSTTQNPAANTDYTHVIEIALDLDDCTSMTGHLFLHFSEPDDPEAYVGGNDG